MLRCGQPARLLNFVRRSSSTTPGTSDRQNRNSLASRYSKRTSILRDLSTHLNRHTKLCSCVLYAVVGQEVLLHRFFLCTCSTWFVSRSVTTWPPRWRIDSPMNCTCFVWKR